MLTHLYKISVWFSKYQNPSIVFENDCIMKCEMDYTGIVTSNSDF